MLSPYFSLFFNILLFYGRALARSHHIIKSYQGDDFDHLYRQERLCANNMGYARIFMLLGDDGNAIRHLESSIKTLKIIAVNDFGEIGKNLIASLINLSSLLFKDGRFKDGFNSRRRANRMAKYLADNYKSNTNIHLYTECLRSVSGLYYEKEKYGHALNYREVAVEILERLFYEDAFRYGMDYGKCLTETSLDFLGAGLICKAKASMDRLEAVLSFFGSQYVFENNAELVFDIGLFYIKQSVFFDDEKAAKSIERGVEEHSKIYHTDFIKYASASASELNNTACILYDDDKVKSATKAVIKSAELFKKLTEINTYYWGDFYHSQKNIDILLGQSNTA